MTSPAVRWGLIKYLAGLPLLPSHTFVTQTNTSQPWPSLASPDHISTNQRQPRTSHIFVRVKYGFQEEYYQRSLTFLYNRLFLKFKISRFAVLSLARMLWTARWWCEVWGVRCEVWGVRCEVRGCEDINPWQEVMWYDESPPRNNLGRGRETQIIIFPLVTPHIILHQGSTHKVGIKENAYNLLKIQIRQLSLTLF